MVYNINTSYYQAVIISGSDKKDYERNWIDKHQLEEIEPFQSIPVYLSAKSYVKAKNCPNAANGVVDRKPKSKFVGRCWLYRKKWLL